MDSFIYNTDRNCHSTPPTAYSLAGNAPLLVYLVSYFVCLANSLFYVPSRHLHLHP